MRETSGNCETKSQGEKKWKTEEREERKRIRRNSGSLHEKGKGEK